MPEAQESLGQCPSAGFATPSPTLNPMMTLNRDLCISGGGGVSGAVHTGRCCNFDFKTSQKNGK